VKVTPTPYAGTRSTSSRSSGRQAQQRYPPYRKLRDRPLKNRRVSLKGAAADGSTADPSVPVPLHPAAEPPTNFPDLGDLGATFVAVGGDFLVAVSDGHVVGMGGFRPGAHPATRRRGIGRALMAELERRAVRVGLRSAFLDTATNQPEAMAFYQGLGYREVGRERQPAWTWTLVYYLKDLTAPECQAGAVEKSTPAEGAR
jgi:GNAT superfamily N-acetyltransferase